MTRVLRAFGPERAGHRAAPDACCRRAGRTRTPRRRRRNPSSLLMPAPSVANTRWPTAVFSTMSAKTICRLEAPGDRRPVDRAAVRSRTRSAIAEDDDRAEQRLQNPEHQRTSPTIRRPRQAARSSPMVIARLGQARAPRRAVRDRGSAVRAPASPARTSSPGLAHDHDADGRIDRILDPIAAGAERDRRAADQLGVDARSRSRRASAVTTCRSATCGSRL